MNRLFQKLLPNSLKAIFVFSLLFFSTAFAEQIVTELPDEWPQDIIGDKGTVVIYQPQPEKLNGNILTGRAAMSLELKDKKEPIFGVFWFSSIIETDRDTNSAKLTEIKVLRVGWPESKKEDEKKFTDFVEAKLAGHSFSMELSALTASLTSAEQVKKSLENIKNDPPVITFSNSLAVLLTYDGKAVFKDIDKSHYQRAMNTTFAVVKDKTSANSFYLTSGNYWYVATNAMGPWTFTSNPPSDLVAMMPKDQQVVTKDKTAAVPAIVTANKPTELIVTTGEPKWTSLAGGQLLYVENTESPWLRELATGDMYLLLSGRWFKSKDQQGPWTFVRADKLPESFQNIPPDSEIGGLRTSVAGTDEAEQAVLDAQIPQTAAIKRSEASLTVEYHGKPQFVSIPGTDVAYAENTGAQVLKINNVYYAVDNGVWFTSKSPEGMWVVADSIPNEAIDSIPPSSPVYNTTYVKVYDSTPEVVYVGYTPGYMWSYPYYGVPIYGTGWYYPPYMGGWYYPRPPTWGMHVGYSPYGGWRVGVSWGSPFFRVGVSWGGGYPYYRPCCGGFYGGGYRGGYHHTSINVNGNINIGNSVNIGNRPGAGNRPSTRPGNRDNIYNRPGNKDRNVGNKRPSTQPVNKGGNRPSTGKVNGGANRPAQKPAVNPSNRARRTNNVYADKKGQVMRHNNGQWQSRQNNQWKNTRPSNNQSKNRSQMQNRNQNMNRDLRGRNMGSQNRSMRSMGGMGGGGRGRR